MGGAGFEPAKDKSNRFTVCPVWPLRYPPATIYRHLNHQGTSANTLSFLVKKRQNLAENEADGGTRTPDQLFTKQLLYQLSYAGKNSFETRERPLLLGKSERESITESNPSAIRNEFHAGCNVHALFSALSPLRDHDATIYSMPPIWRLGVIIAALWRLGTDRIRFVYCSQKSFILLGRVYS